MALPPPAWRVQTRPCPFYQQGRCIFSDSCNFLHTTSAKISRDVTTGPLPLLPSTPSKPPLVTIQSPQSIRSPPRSPRLSDLLFVLQDVIGKDPEEAVEDTLVEALHYEVSEYATLIDESGLHKEPADIHSSISLIQQVEDQSPVDDSGSFSTKVAEPNPDNDDTLRPILFHEAVGQPSIRTVESSPDVEQPSATSDMPSPSYDLLSPVELSHLNLKHFSQDFGVPIDDADSGYAETWKTPGPFVMSPPRSPMNSTFDLLPSPFGTPSARVISPRLSAFISRHSSSPVGSTCSVDYVPSDLSLDSPVGESFTEPRELNTGMEEVPQQYFIKDSVEAMSPNALQAIQSDLSFDLGNTFTEPEEPTAEMEEVPQRYFIDEAISPDVLQAIQPDLSLDSPAGNSFAEPEEPTEMEGVPQQYFIDEAILPNALQAIQPDPSFDSPADNSFTEPEEPTTEIEGVPQQYFIDEAISPNAPQAIQSDLSFDSLAGNSFTEPEEPITEMGGDSQQYFIDEAILPNALQVVQSQSDLSFGSSAGNSFTDPEEPNIEMEGYSQQYSIDEAISPNALQAIQSQLDLSLELPASDSFTEGPNTGMEEDFQQDFIDETVGVMSPNVLVQSDLSLDLPADNSFTESNTETEGVSPQSFIYGTVNDSLGPVNEMIEEVTGDVHSEDFAELGPTAVWDLEGQSTAVYVGMPPLAREEVTRAMETLSSTPTHFLMNPVDFDDNGPIANSFSMASPVTTPVPILSQSVLKREIYPVSSPVEGVIPQPEDDFDERNSLLNDSPTARLAYLISPNIPDIPNENDTLNSIYDDYSAFLAENNNSDASSSVVAVSSDAEKRYLPSTTPEPIPAGLFHERVFTPPLVNNRERSGTITVRGNSPAPARSSMSTKAASRGRASTFSTQARSAWSPDSQVSDVSDVSSKKVPFGFRHSLALRGTNKPLTIPTRISQDNPRTTLKSDKKYSPDISSPTSPVASGLRPLRLSTTLGAQPPAVLSRKSEFAVNSYYQSENTRRISISSTSVSSNNSLSDNILLSSARSSLIPGHISNTLLKSHDPPKSPNHLTRFSKHFEVPHSAPVMRPLSWRLSSPTAENSSEIDRHSYRPSSRFSEPSFGNGVDEENDDTNEEDSYDHTIRRPLPVLPHTAPVAYVTSNMHPSIYAIATPPPTLMFAIASDDVNQVRQVLENGDARPNDSVGPQSALAFALTNDQLVNKMDIVKTLLAYGADPTVLKGLKSKPAPSSPLDGDAKLSPTPIPLIDTIDPATRYYVERADAPHTRRTSALIHRSFFRPLTRVRYELIGQDRALEQLFRVLSIHSRQLSVTPIVVLLCGPSGHGKSLLARKFGSLLDVPTHTVNMTTLKSTNDMWQSYSMSPYETPTTCTLAEFLINNEGKRCVVVLDEIEKTYDEKTLWSLLMPWELGRCAFEANGRHIDVRNVIWLGTSNIGHDLVFEHHEARALPDELMSREEYVELMGLLRPRVSDRLGASILSRVTTVLPFVPFTLKERRAICSEALYSIAGDMVRTLSTDVVDSMVAGALAGYSSAEGARSLYRAVSNQLVDNI